MSAAIARPLGFGLYEIAAQVGKIDTTSLLEQKEVAFMATKTVAIKVTPDDSVKAFDIEVDDKEVPIINNEGTVDVTTGDEHELTWRFAGDAGATLSIVGKVGQKKVIDVSDSIPDGEIHGEGSQDFTVD